MTSNPSVSKWSRMYPLIRSPGRRKRPRGSKRAVIPCGYRSISGSRHTGGGSGGATQWMVTRPPSRGRASRGCGGRADRCESRRRRGGATCRRRSGRAWARRATPRPPGTRRRGRRTESRRRVRRSSASGRRQVRELRVPLEERELDRVGRAVAVLRDVHLCEPLLVGLLGVVVLVAVDEHNKIRILLDTIVCYKICNNEVVQTFDGEVIDVLLAVGLDQHDPVPEDVAPCKVAKLVRVDDLGDTCRAFPAQP